MNSRTTFCAACEPRRLDVLGLHRAGDVDHEHDRRLLAVGEPVHARAREADEQRGEREQEEREPGVAAPRPCALDDAGEHVQVRVADGVLRRPPLQPAVGEHDQRQQQQAEQEERGGEAQLGPFAQTAWICTSTRTFCGRVIPERTSTTTRSAGAAGGRAHRAEGGERGRTPRAERDGGGEGEDALAVRGTRGTSRSLCRSFSRTFLTRQTVASGSAAPRPAARACRLGSSCGCGRLRRWRGCSRAAAGSRTASGSSARRRRRRGAWSRPARPDRRGCRGSVIPSGPARSASRPPITWPRPGQRELVVGRRRGAEDLHPGAGDGDADDQAVALSAGVGAPSGSRPRRPRTRTSTGSSRLITAASRTGRPTPRRPRAGAGRLRPRSRR